MVANTVVVVAVAMEEQEVVVAYNLVVAMVVEVDEMMVVADYRYYSKALEAVIGVLAY